MKKLTDLWANNNDIKTFDDIGTIVPLGDSAKGGHIDTLYLEHNPIASEFEYRIVIAKMLPSLHQLDATYCRTPRSPTTEHNREPVSEAAKAALRRIQAMQSPAPKPT